MNPQSRILLIEDDASLASALASVLSAEGYSVDRARRGDDGCQQADNGSFDLVLTDLRLPGLGGIDVIRRIHGAHPDTPILLMTAHGTTETAIEAMKEGAFDYLLKPFEMEELLATTARALASRRLRTDNSTGRSEATPSTTLVGRSRAMQALYKEIGRVAAKPVTVLIRGETGTGKELIARAIYAHSDRTHGPFVAVNCAAIPETLLESELFGHERGAFTGAVERRLGRFEQAHNGTLFLDEIGEMGAPTQAKLLRVLQDKSLQRIGGRDSIDVDVRIIAATHVHLEEAIANRTFREDLYYRLNQITLTLPPLRERTEDISLLAAHFVQKHASTLGFRPHALQPSAVETLVAHPWPGNVRELENVIRQALLLTNGFPIADIDIREVLRRGTKPDTDHDSLRSRVAETLNQAERGEVPDAYDHLVHQLELELFTQAMERASGNQARAARWLGISRVTLREKLRLHGLKEPAESSDSATN